MSNSKVQFVCSNCGEVFSRWAGKCSNCGEWNTLKEQKIEEAKTSKVHFDRALFGVEKSLPSLLKDIPPLKTQRLSSNVSEFDRVLGGGLVTGSLNLISGEPGMGKSTLALQVAATVSQKHPVLYVSGEESLSQIKLRAERLEVKTNNLHLLNETNLDAILNQIAKIKPALIIVDSIQTIQSDSFTGVSGSVSQVSNCANVLLEVAKATNITVILIGHVTKTGMVAGPMVLEHIVDAVLFLEGERYHDLRILRVLKNRFGSALEVGVFQMQNAGLLPVTNPSRLFLGERGENKPGAVIFPLVEGNRPFLVEIQALVNKTILAYPRRTASGFSFNRLQVLIAVLQKCCGLKLHNTDVYVNVVGGFKVQEPAADLAVSLAIASSLLNKALSPAVAVIGEVGLLGDLRSVQQLEKRVAEVKRLGFKECIIGGAQTGLKTDGIKTHFVTDLKQALVFLK